MRIPALWTNPYEPDFAYQSTTSPLPCVVFETGYTESWSKLLENRNIWLKGNVPNINAVCLLLKFNKKSNNRVAGYLELHRRARPVLPRVVSSGSIAAKRPKPTDITPGYFPCPSTRISALTHYVAPARFLPRWHGARRAQSK